MPIRKMSENLLKAPRKIRIGQVLNDIIDPGCYGLFRDGGLIIIDNCTLRKVDIIRKKTTWIFSQIRI